MVSIRRIRSIYSKIDDDAMKVLASKGITVPEIGEIGRARQLVATVEAMGLKALQRIGETLDDPDPQLRFKAAEWVVTRVIGKPDQKVTGRIEVNHTVDHLAALEALATKPKVLEHQAAIASGAIVPADDAQVIDIYDDPLVDGKW